jgi:hypothetical protein
MKRITYSEELARSIQNWGEQDPRIHNAEMKRWRKVWGIRARLEYLRGELAAERVSYGELAELQSLAEYIPVGDTQLREAAGLCEAHNKLTCSECEV